MIVYRDQRTRADPRQLLSDLQRRMLHSGARGPSHELAIGILIDAGILESAVTDAVFPAQDGVSPLTEAFRKLSLAAGHVVWHSWHSDPEGLGFWWDRLTGAANGLRSYWLPPVVETTQPEGYSHYSLYPETYLEAAKSFVAGLGRVTTVCVGIRSIGCSLAGMVAASLEELGCPVESFTIRPRGHPFSRRPRFTNELAGHFASRQQSHFLLVDEGPGISGSSLAGTAGRLHELGIANDHIHLFPAWLSDGSQLRSSAAREQWSRHRQFTCGFEEVWLGRGRLQQTFPGKLSDVSAGRWRARILADAHPHPAVHPQHERRKYLVSNEDSSEPGYKLLSFAGLGGAGERKVARLAQLAQAGFSPAPEQLAHGFLLRSFATGIPVHQGSAGLSLLEFVAAYLAHLYRSQVAEPTTSADCMEEMICVNVAEGLKAPELEKRVKDLPREAWTEHPVALDGRMLAHEWIATPQGYLKVDAMDHHDDHFFPGSTDIAWDVMGACIELDLPGPERTYLISRYRTLSDDRTIGSRLHPYTVAYLAFRLGYTALAAETLVDSVDGQRFADQRRRYHDLLVRELSNPQAVWDV